MKRHLIPFLLLLILALPACSKKAPAPLAKPVHQVGAGPIDVQLLEQDNFNIPYWLVNGAKGRVLVRFSENDGLFPLPDKVLEVLSKLTEKKDFDAIVSGGEATAGDSFYSSRNTMYIASKMGIADEIYWVVPLYRSVTQDDLDGFKKFLETEFPDQKDNIEKLQITDNMAQGTVNGVPFKLVSLLDLPRIDKPVLLDIDISYFAGLYQSEKSTKMLSLVSGFFKTLKEQNLRSDMVTISASNKDGVVPYKFRFLAGYLEELFKNPKIIDGQPPKLWLERSDAWKAEQVSFKQAIPLYKNILDKFPQDADTHYDLSYAYFKTGDLEGCRKELAEAARLKPGYNGAYMEYSNRLVLSGKKSEARKLFGAVKER